MKKDRFHFLLMVPLILIPILILLISLRKSVEYRIYDAKQEEQLVTYDRWELVPLDCAGKKECTESSERLITPFYNDTRLLDFRNQNPTNSFRIKAKISDIPGIEAILASGDFSIVVPKMDTHSINLFFYKLNSQSNKFGYNTYQKSRQHPTSFHFEKGNSASPAFDLDHTIEMDFHLYEGGVLGTKNFPIGFVTKERFSDFIFAVSPASSQDKNGEVLMIFAIMGVALFSYLARRQSSYLSFVFLLMSVCARTLVVYFVDNKIFPNHLNLFLQSYVFLQMIFVFILVKMYLELMSLFLSNRVKIISFGVMALSLGGSIYAENTMGFVWWMQKFWIVDAIVFKIPFLIVLFFGLRYFFQKTLFEKINSSVLKNDFALFYRYEKELFYLSLIYLIFGLMQVITFFYHTSTSLSFSHAIFMGLLLILKEYFLFSHRQKLMIQPDLLESASLIHSKIETLKGKHPLPYLAYLNQQKMEHSLKLLQTIGQAFHVIHQASAKIRLYQSPATQSLSYQEFLVSDLDKRSHWDLMISSSPIATIDKKELRGFLMVEAQKIKIHLFANHSLSDIPHVSLCLETFPHASLSGSGDWDWLTKAIEVYSRSLDHIANHVHRVFRENDPILRQLGYQSLIEVKPDFTFQRYLPALMIDIRGYSKLILQKDLGCYDMGNNPLEISHSQILNLLFKPFLDLAFKNKMTRIGPNGDSLILFGPVNESEPQKCLTMLKTALDAKELYEHDLDHFKHQNRIHPECYSKITLQFGRALGWGEINVNLIAGNYSGQLDYHSETINLLARVEKFTKKLNADLLITQDLLDGLEQEKQPGDLDHIVIRYLGAYEFDASAQLVKLYQVGYAHKMNPFFLPSESFNEAIRLRDEKNDSQALICLKKHLETYPLDATAMAIQTLWQSSRS